MTKLAERRTRANDRLSARLQKIEQRRAKTAAIPEEKVAEKKKNSNGVEVVPIKVVPEAAEQAASVQMTEQAAMKGNDGSTLKQDNPQDIVQILRRLLCRVINSKKKAKKCFKAAKGKKSKVMVQKEFVGIFTWLRLSLQKELKAMTKMKKIEETWALTQQLELLEAFLEDSMMQELMWLDAIGSKRHLDLPMFKAWLQLDASESFDFDRVNRGGEV